MYVCQKSSIKRKITTALKTSRGLWYSWIWSAQSLLLVATPSSSTACTRLLQACVCPCTFHSSRTQQPCRPSPRAPSVLLWPRPLLVRLLVHGIVHDNQFRLLLLTRVFACLQLAPRSPWWCAVSSQAALGVAGHRIMKIKLINLLLLIAGAVRCQVSKQTVQKAAAAVSSLPAMLAVSPAFALVSAALRHSVLLCCISDRVSGRHVLGLLGL